MLFSLLIPIALCLGSALTTSAITHRDVFWSLPVSLFLITFFVYFSGLLFGTLGIGIVIALLYSVLFIPIAIRFRLPGETIPQFVKRKANAHLHAIIVVLAIYLLVVICNWQRMFTAWDEFSHWGVMAKEMFRLDNFYCAPESLLSVHRDYPPFVVLFEYIFCKVGAAYSEPQIYRALHFLTFSLFLLPLSRSFASGKSLSSQKTGAIIFPAVSFALSIYLICSLAPTGKDFFRTIYLDVFVGVLGASCLYYSIREDMQGWASVGGLAILLSGLLLSKQVGVLFFALSVIVLAVRIVIIDKKAGAFKFSTQAYRLLILIFLPIAVSISWKLVLHRFGEAGAGQFNLTQIAKSLIGSVTGGDASSLSVIQKFLSATIFYPLVQYPISLSYAFVVAVLATFPIVITKLAKNLSPQTKSDFYLVATAIAVGGAGYACMLMMLYLGGGFTDSEVSRLASFARYMGTFTLSSFVLLSLMVISCNELYCIGTINMPGQTSRLNKICVLCNLVLLLMVALVPGGITKLMPVLNARIDPYQSNARKIQAVTQETDSVFILDQKGNGNAYFHLAYHLDPQPTGKPFFKVTANANNTGSPTVVSGTMAVASLEDLKRELSGYSYLYVVSYDDYFKDTCAGLFDAVSELSEGQLYRVAVDADGNLKAAKAG